MGGGEGWSSQAKGHGKGASQTTGVGGGSVHSQNDIWIECNNLLKVLKKQWVTCTLFLLLFHHIFLFDANFHTALIVPDKTRKLFFICVV